MLPHVLPECLAAVLGRGYAGVQLFFVVSAFTLCASLAGRADEPAPLRAYLLRRACRILPMFWGAIGLYLVLDGFGPRWGVPDGLTGAEIALAALLLHGFNLHALNGVVPGGWSVAVEVQFYLLLPLLLRRSRTLRRAGLLWLGLVGLSVAALPGLEALLAPLYPAAQRDLVHQFAFYALPTQLPVFGGGLILYRLLGPDRAILTRAERWLPRRPATRAAGAVLLVAALGLPLRLTSRPPALVPGFPGHLGYGVLFALLAYALATAPLALLVNRVTCHCGRISYSAYLLHFAALDAAARVLPPALTAHPLSQLAALGASALAVTVIGASLTHALIEQPGIALGRYIAGALWGRLHPHQPASPGPALPAGRVGRVG